MIQKQAPDFPENFPDLAKQVGESWHYLASWVSVNFSALLVASAAALVLYLLFSWLCAFAAKRVDYSRKPMQLGQILARTIARTTRFFRIMLAIEAVSFIVKAPWPLAQAIAMLFTLAAVFQCAIWLREILIGTIERRAALGGEQSDTLRSAMALIRMAISFTLFAIASIIVLDNIGVNVTGLVAGLGVGGIAIGLAAQGIFSDLFAAIAIIFDHPFKKGDTVGYDTTTARVERIGMKSTRLRALTGEMKVISNSKLLEKELTNYSELTERRTTFILGLVLHTPPEKIAALPDKLAKLVEAQGASFVRAGMTGFGASALDMQLVFDCECTDHNDVFKYRHAIGIGLLKLLAKEKLELAYPTQTTYTAAPDGSLVMPYAPAIGQAVAKAAKHK